jgi:hypothetical protein
MWEFKLILKYKHQCHCACSSEIGTCIINDAGRQAAHTKKQRKYTLYTCYEGISLFDFYKSSEKNS